MLFYATIANATGFSDLKFGAAQFSDTQWNVSACLYTSTCQIYSLSGIGTSYNTGSPYHLSTGQYIQFSSSGNSAYPWEMKVYNSNGTLARDLGAGKLTVQGLGTDSSGHHFFFFTNAYYNGTVFSTDYGFPNSNGFSFTGTLNPTTTQTDTFAGSGSTSPLNAGQTYTSAPPPPTYPIATITSSEQTYINQTTTIGYNSVYIYQTGGNYTNINITQTGDFNSIRGIGGGSYIINGGNNSLTITQGSQTNGYHNLLEGSITGNNNTLQVVQSSSSNYEQTLINGSSNILSSTQDGNKSLFANISGSGNNITTTQTNGNHFLELNIPTNNNTVSVTQSGMAQKMFSLTLNNSNIGVTVVQDNATTPDSASMSITCTSGSCSGYTYTKH